MRRGIYILLIVILLVALLMLNLIPIFAEEYYIIGQGPVYDIEQDHIPGQLIVVSGEDVYIINASNGNVVNNLPVPGITIRDIKAGNPQNHLIYGVGGGYGGGLEFSINRSTGQINDYNLDNNIIPTIQLQNTDKLFAISKEQGLYEDSLHDKIYVFNKSDLSQESIWDCEEWPESAEFAFLYDNIIVAEGLPRAYGDVTSPWEPGTLWFSRIGQYDPSREGSLVNEWLVGGMVTGLAIMSNGAIIVGLTDKKEYGVWASTLAIIDEPIEYVDIESYHISCMDYEIATNRVFCALYDYEENSSGDILVWDYDTREYDIIDSGIERLQIVTFLDGKLYASTGKDNKVYIINID